MKQIFLVRHAKSSWTSGVLSDFDRPLNDRGKRDAPVMAQRLKNKYPLIDGWVSSPAKRALQTATIFTELYKVPTTSILPIPTLYHAPSEVFDWVITALPNEFTQVALFSHNPGITDYCNSLVENVTLDNMPTCGIFSVTAPINDWQSWQHTPKQFSFFDYPKLIP